MNKNKILPLIFLIIAALIYGSVILHRIFSEESEKYDEEHKGGIGLASVLVIVSLVLGIKEKKDEGMKAGDYLQLTSIFLALILLIMSIYKKWGFSAYTMLVGIVLISTSEFIDFSK